MNYLTRFIIRWPLGCLIFFAAACGHASSKELPVLREDSSGIRQQLAAAEEQIAAAAGIVHSGDIITRTGNDFTSQSLRRLNQRDQRFSHCGIASIEHDSLFVYHALGGEWNPDQKIKREPFALFAEPYSNNGIGIFRYANQQLSPGKLVAAARACYLKGIPFDMDFDLATDDRLYCAEFVAKSIATASGGKIFIHRSHINQFEFIGVDDIILNEGCQPQRMLRYR